MQKTRAKSGSGWGKRYISLVLVLLLPLLQGQISREEDLKAALLISIVRFTEWPPSESPITLGIVNQPELLASVTRLSMGKTVLGRAIQVRGVKYLADVKQCHAVHFGALQGKKLEELLQPARELNVLTIGDTDRFLAAGGTIHIFVEDGRFNFEVSLAALNQTKLSISSKLLRLGYLRRDVKTVAEERPRP